MDDFVDKLKNLNSKMLKHLGDVCYLKGDLDKAIEYFEKAIELDDNYDEAYEARNQAMLERHLEIAEFQDDLKNNSNFNF